LVDYRAHGQNTTRRHRELCRSIDQVLRLHQWSASERGDRALVVAYQQSIRSNDRFAWWSALRAARNSPRSLREVAWAIRFAPRAPGDAALRRIRGNRG